MFKLREFCNDSHKGFALQLMTPWDEDSDTKENLLNIKFWRCTWWFSIPQIIKPKSKWVDLSHKSWASEGKDGRKGYTNNIQRSYGFSADDSSVHVHYGIQPGCWISDDPENSDHVKVFDYFWNATQTRHYVVDSNGVYLCNGSHFLKWSLKNSVPYNKETRNEDFEKLPEFVYPLDDKIEPKWIFSEKFEYDNWSKETRPGSDIYKMYDYTDYDDMKTRAKCYVEIRESQKGKWAWLRAILKYLPNGRHIRRSLRIEFRDAVGREKGSWKGGTTGTGIKMNLEECMDEAWQRFVNESKFKKM